MRKLLALSGLLVLIATSTALASGSKGVSTWRVVHNLRHSIQLHRTRTWQLQDKVGTPRKPTVHAERRTRSVAFLRWINGQWNTSQKVAAKNVKSVPHLSLWMCIHSYEAGDWFNRDTGHNGHYGGLQMSYSWGWPGYGLKGYAYNYSELQQMQAAERGYRANGYSTSWILQQWYHPSCV